MLPGSVVAKKCSLLFLGDMDPADLMIFAWLREFLRPKSIVHLGVNDQYIAELAVFYRNRLSCNARRQS